MFLMALFIVLVTSFYLTTQDIGRSVAASSFISFIFALTLAALDLLSPLGLFITLIAAGIGVATSFSKT